jgi:predicted RNA methylase
VNRYLKGFLYIAQVRSETAPWYSLKGKIKKMSLVGPGKSPVAITTSSATDMPIDDESVDYVFTDPPFGGNIIYSELNFMWEAWLGVITEQEAEAIVSKAQEKTLSEYQDLMGKSFKEYCRVLKPGGWMTVEFHNSHNAVWIAIQRALESSGFVVADVRVFDKKQLTMKQQTTTGAVKKDLIISAYRPNGGLEDRFTVIAGTDAGVWSFVETHLRQLPVFGISGGVAEALAERTQFLLFDRMVAFHVQRGVGVPMSAAEFHAGLHEKYPERDGMYFLPEQVADYDRQRMAAGEIAQLEFFVSNEATAIQWLKQQLQKKPQSFQEIQPQFMKKAGWDKHEKELELSELLEQNFLRYDGDGDVPSQIHGYLSSNFKDARKLEKDDAKLKARAKERWYVPDPRKEVDLEKIRHRALMKEFDEYRDAKGKLKAVRSEALRAGFKDCWQKNDYAAIVEMAGRVREEIIQEDPALLMYYDNAVMLTGE